MKSLSQKLLILLLLLGISGCNSIGLRKSHKTYGSVYLPTSVSFHAAKGLSSSNPDEQVVGVLGTISLPLDLIVDTVCLPYDVYNINKSSKFDSYGKSGWREYQLNSQKRLCKTVRYQMKTYQFSMYQGDYFSGHTTTKDGVLNGESKMWWSRDRVYLTGEYKNGVPWNGTILMGAADPCEMVAGPLNTYENGVLVASSNIVINLETTK